MSNSLAVMFPGLGADYPQMVARYLETHPQDAALVAHWFARVGVTLGEVPEPFSREAERLRQLEVHALNLLWWRRCGHQSKGAFLCGHSLGYYAALVAAGVIDEDDSFRLIDAVFTVGWQGFAESDERGILVVTTKHDVDFADRLAGLLVEVLSDNSPQQRVLYGTRAELEQVRERLNGELLATTQIPARVPFHSRRMLALREEVANAVEALGVRPRPLTAPLWSHISTRPIPSGAEALALVVDQLHLPVRWRALIDALIQAGRYEFIEVGPNRILSQLVRWICPQLEVGFVDNLRRQGSKA